MKKLPKTINITLKIWRQQKPESLHAMVTPLHMDVTDRYLKDLKESVETIRANPKLAVSGRPARVKPPTTRAVVANGTR